MYKITYFPHSFVMSTNLVMGNFLCYEYDLWPQRLVLNAGLQRYETDSGYTEIPYQFSKQVKLLMLKCLTLILPGEIGSKILVCGPCGVDCSSPDNGHFVSVWVSALLKISQKVQKTKTYKKQK